VSVQNNSFSPADIQIAKGSTVTWTWSQGATDHNVTFTDGTHSPDMSSGTYTKTFSTAGTFSYQCTLHGGMNGTITVQ